MHLIKYLKDSIWTFIQKDDWVDWEKDLYNRYGIPTYLLNW